MEVINSPDALLDLLNSTPMIDGTPTELLDGAWLRAHGVTGRRVDDARRLRDELQQVVRGEAPAVILDVYLRGVTQTPSIGGDRDGDPVTWRVHADWPALMVLAWGEVQSAMPGRLRACANGECHLFLLDRSRGGTGRWCSMSECGNRMKARRHYNRSAGRSGD